MKNLVQIPLFILGMILLSTACEPEPTDCIDPAQIDPGGVCTGHYDPVCGCDGLTYGNDCSATIAGVTSWTIGACQDQCIDESLIDPDAACITLYDPVCGCNDVTYSNGCFASISGVTSWTIGECP